MDIVISYLDLFYWKFLFYYSYNRWGLMGTSECQSFPNRRSIDRVWVSSVSCLIRTHPTPAFASALSFFFFFFFLFCFCNFSFFTLFVYSYFPFYTSLEEVICCSPGAFSFSARSSLGPERNLILEDKNKLIILVQ